MKRAPGAGMLVPILVVLVSGCSGGAANGVVVSNAQSRTISAHPGGPGLLAAGVDVPVSLGYRGTVTRVDVALGQQVTAGQPLLGISSDELARSVAELSVRKQTDEANVAALDATLRLPSTVTKPTVAAAQQDKAVAARAKVALDQRLLEAAQSKADVLRAPVSGVVAALSAQPGTPVTPAARLLEIVDPATMTAAVQVPISYQSQIAVGAPVELSAVGVPGIRLTGTVTGVAPQTVKDGQTFVVSAKAENPGGHALPGMAVYARFAVTRSVPVAVNRLAIRNRGEGPSVLVVSDGRVQLRTVVVGLGDDSATEIVKGLAPGESVVIAGAQSLQDGQQVRVDAARRSP